MQKKEPIGPFRQLKEFQDLQASVYRDIEKVWQIDSSGEYDEKLNLIGYTIEEAKERTEIIERVFYKIANEWLER